MGRTTDDGFIIETSGDGEARDGATHWIVLALDEAEALDVVKNDMPDRRHKIVASGDDIRAQAARLGVEPGTCQQI